MHVKVCHKYIQFCVEHKKKGSKHRALHITIVERTTCYIQGDCKTDRLNKFNHAAIGPIVRLFSYRTYHAVLKKLWTKLFNMSNVLLEGMNK